MTISYLTDKLNTLQAKGHLFQGVVFWVLLSAEVMGLWMAFKHNFLTTLVTLQRICIFIFKQKYRSKQFLRSQRIFGVLFPHCNMQPLVLKRGTQTLAQLLQDIDSVLMAPVSHKKGNLFLVGVVFMFCRLHGGDYAQGSATDRDTNPSNAWLFPPASL